MLFSTPHPPTLRKIVKWKFSTLRYNLYIRENILYDIEISTLDIEKVPNQESSLLVGILRVDFVHE